MLFNQRSEEERRKFFEQNAWKLDQALKASETSPQQQVPSHTEEVSSEPTEDLTETETVLDAVEAIGLETAAEETIEEFDGGEEETAVEDATEEAQDDLDFGDDEVEEAAEDDLDLGDDDAAEETSSDDLDDLDDLADDSVDLDDLGSEDEEKKEDDDLDFDF